MNSITYGIGYFLVILVVNVFSTDLLNLCTLPPESGNCMLYDQKWYYEPSRDQCYQFVYTGCFYGIENGFETHRDCEARCKRSALTTITVATPPQQRAEEECRTPSSVAPCGNNMTVFYYNSERRQCLISGFEGCGHPNTYRTEEECERTCGDFRGIDVCGAHLDPGPCRAFVNKIYWDAMTGSCQPYAYGGCFGGPNRFSNVEECMSICGDTGPGPTGSPVPANKTNETSLVLVSKTIDDYPGADNKTSDESKVADVPIIVLAVVLGVGVILGFLVILHMKKCCRVKSNTEQLPQTYVPNNPFYVNLLFRRECQQEIYEREHQYEEIN